MSGMARHGERRLTKASETSAVEMTMAMEYKLEVWQAHLDKIRRCEDAKIEILTFLLYKDRK